MTRPGRSRLFSRISRRVLVIVLVGVAGVAIGAAVAIPTFAVPRLRKIPLSVSADTISVAPDSSVLDIGAMMHGHARTQTGVPLRIQDYVATVDPSDRRRVTFQAATSITRTDRSGPSRLVSASVDRVTVDRATALPVPDPPGLIADLPDKPGTTVPRNGYQYQFPFDTGKRDYLYFDTTAHTDQRLHYLDDRRREGGMVLYHFRQTVGPMDLYPGQPTAQLTLSAASWGLPGSTPVRFDLHYQCDRDIWVEPTSGVVVAVAEHVHRWLARSADDPRAVTSLEIHTTFDAETLDQTTRLARNGRTRIRAAGIYLPVALGGVGVLALVTGIVVAATSRNRATQD